MELFSLHRLCLATCLTALTAFPAVAERVASGAPEFPRETEALVQATVSLFEETEARSFPEITPTLRLTPVQTSTNGGETPNEAFSPDHGPVRHLTGYRITWYPVDTLLGAVDFMGTWDNSRNLVCGYVTWDLSDPDAPVMRDLVTNYIDVSDIIGEDSAAQEAALLDANCAFGDVDANYAALN